MQFAYENESSLHDTTFAASSKPITGVERYQRSLRMFRTFQLFSETKWIINLQALLVPSGRLAIPGQIQFYFQLINEHEKHGQLLRGLMALGQTKNTVISFSRVDRTFSIVIGLSNEESVARHLEKALSLFTEEILFKNKLRNILKIERKLKDEISALYAVAAT